MWVDNVVAVGNAGGFVEPLEATALMIVCSHCQTLVDFLLHSEMEPTPSMRDLYNDLTRATWHDIRDFLGLRVDLGARLQTEDLVTRLMARTVAPIIPTVQLRLSVDAKEAEKWVIRNREVKSQKAEPKIVIALKLIQGKTTINESITEYPLIPCYNIPTHPPDAYGPIGPITLDVDGNPVDWIHVTEQGIGGATVSLGQDAVALANGLIQNGSSPRWISSEAYKGTAFIPMVYPAGQPEDRIETSTDCANDGNTCAEVSVFAKDLGMTFSTLPKENPPKDWKTGLGEIVEIPITQNGPLVVPVEFYILWEHPNDSSNPIDPKASCSAMSSMAGLPTGL